MRIKYTKELLENACKESVSIAQAIRKLGLKEAGGTHSHISRKIKEFGVDTSHFLGQRANCGKNYKGPTKLIWQDVLILRNNGRRQKAHVLRRSLLESGRKYTCEIEGCNVSNEWNGGKIMLHVDHKNSNWLDDRPDNLRFTCPNCHSQTPGYCGSKGLSTITSVSAQHRRK